MSAEDELREAVRRRADALAAADPDGLAALLHPRFRWTSHRGEQFDRESYLEADTRGGLRWHAQVLEQVDVVVVEDTGVVRCVVNDQVDVGGRRRSLRMGALYCSADAGRVSSTVAGPAERIGG